jgi:DAACS family dicarboxylate/amino acid:cation (Na+ or H+) symporter
VSRFRKDGGDSVPVRSQQQQLTFRILVAMGAGLVTGVLINLLAGEGFLREYLVEGLFHVVGAIFLASLKLLVVPLVFSCSRERASTCRRTSPTREAKLPR